MPEGGERGLDKTGNERLRLTRAGIIGDVHTEVATLRRVLDHFARLSVSHILCTGDVPDGPQDASAVEACCELLQTHSVVTVSGNHDRWLQDGEMRDLRDATDPQELSKLALAFLGNLPATVEFESSLGSVLLCHGMGPDDMAGVQPFDHGLALASNAALQSVLRDERHPYVISGHTHRPMVRRLEALTIINAGTLLRDQNACCAVVDFDARRVQFYDIGAAAIQAGSSCSL
jgi:predicted phosphodiesterase